MFFNYCFNWQLPYGTFLAYLNAVNICGGLTFFNYFQLIGQNRLQLKKKIPYC